MICAAAEQSSRPRGGCTPLSHAAGERAGAPSRTPQPKARLDIWAQARTREPDSVAVQLVTRFTRDMHTAFMAALGKVSLQRGFVASEGKQMTQDADDATLEAAIRRFGQAWAQRDIPTLEAL